MPRDRAAQAADQQAVRETWGSYRLTCRRTPDGWRLDGFHYYSKLTRGDDAVRTHPA
jgi:hypothetical protein